MLQGVIINDGNTTMNNGYTAPNATVMNAEPVAEQCEQCIPNATTEDSAEDLTAQFKGLFDAFTENIPQSTEQSKKTKNVFKKFSEYIGSKQFKDDVNEKAEKYHVPPKQIAKNFFLKVLGIIGDILGIVVNTVCSIIDTAISLLSTLLHGAVTVIGKAGNGIARLVSLNQTNLVTA